MTFINKYHKWIKEVNQLDKILKCLFGERKSNVTYMLIF